MVGLAEGFAQGYGLVANVQDRRKRRALQKQRLEDQRAYRQDLLDMKQQGLDQQAARYKVENEHWDKNFGLKQQRAKDMAAYRQGQLALGRGRLAISQQGLAVKQYEAAAKQARLDKERVETERYNYLQAAANEISHNGVTEKGISLLSQGGVPVEDMIDPKWQHSLDVVKAALGGAPVSKNELVSSGGRVFQDKINKIVGTKTKDGQTIIRAQLNNIVPGQNEDTVHLGLKLWKQDKNGNISEYKAPVTEGRSAHDDYVLDVPLEQVVKHVQGLSILDKAIPKDQLMPIIQQQELLLKGKISNGVSKQDDTPTIKDLNERAAAATKQASGGLKDAMKNNGQLAGDPVAQKQFLNRHRNYYMRAMAPFSKIPNPASDLVEALKKNGGQMIARKGKYKGQTIILRNDGSVIARKE